MKEKEKQLTEKGVTVLHTSKGGKVDLKELMELLGERGIDSILLEGGGELNAAAFSAGIVSKVQAYIAGKIIGGETSKTPVTGKGAMTMKDASVLRDLEVRMVGEDICMTGYPVTNSRKQ